MNAAGGQFASLHDLTTLTQMLLNPHRPGSLITPYSMSHWMNPVHAFEEDDWTEIGIIWEIIKHRDSNDRLRRIYWKRALNRKPLHCSSFFSKLARWLASTLLSPCTPELRTAWWC